MAVPDWSAMRMFRVRFRVNVLACVVVFYVVRRSC